MSDANPYAAPQTNETLAPNSELSFGHLDDKKFKKLYYRSCNVTAITACLAIGMVILVGLTAAIIDGGVSYSIAILGGIVLFYVAAIIGLILRTSWGRIMGIIACIFSLISFPIGTVIGVAGLFAFFGAPQLFGANRILHKDLKAEFKLRKKLKKQGR